MPFGEKWQSAAANEDDMGFTGHINDATGITYMQARFYDPVTGRFLSMDPVGFLESGNQSAMYNRFSYAFNDPVNLTDPTGECPMCIAIAIFIAKEIAAEGASQATGGATDFLSVRRMGTKAVKAGGEQLAKRRAKQLEINKAKGDQGEALTEKRIGDDLAGKQVILKSSTTGQKVRMDFVKKDGSVVETKTGNAELSPNQQAVKNDIDAGNPVIPRGAKAEAAGLRKNEPVKLPSCEVDRPC